MSEEGMAGRTGCGEGADVSSRADDAKDAGPAVERGRIVVVKVGTSTLTDPDGYVRHAAIDDLVRQVASVRAGGDQVVLVSSGAIAVGLERLGLPGRRPSDLPTLQAAAAVGQTELMHVYEQAFARCGISVGQVLLTRGITERRHAYLNARNTLLRLLDLGAVPIVNENDTVSVDEVRFGDNDSLAALVATLVGARLVILCTDIEGLYTADPRTSEDAELLEHVGRLTDEVVEAAGGAGTPNGSGGMATKVKAARMLMAAHIPMVICRGSRPDVIVDVASGRSVGTMFERDDDAPALHARKLWIALGGKPQGTLTIDDGARRALCERGSSLLPVGVTKVTGTFGKDAPVELRDAAGRLVGRGLAGLTSDELALVAGRRSDEVAANGLVAHLAGKPAVHRDQLVVF